MSLNLKQRTRLLSETLLAQGDGVLSATATFGSWKLYFHMQGDFMWVVEDARGTRTFYATAQEAVAMIESQRRVPVLEKLGRYVWRYGENGKETDRLVIA